MTSAWERACREHLAQTRTWDMTAPANRWAVRQWSRRLWWARFGVYVSGSAGVALGASAVLGCYWLLVR